VFFIRSLVMLFALSIPSAFAAHDWDWIGAESTQWSVKNNWSTASGDATPQAGDTVRLRNAARLPSQQNIPNLVFTKLVIAGDCPAFTISGSPITLNKGGVDVEIGAGAVTLATPVVLADQQLWTVPAGQTLSVTGSISALALTFSVSGLSSANNTIIDNLSSSTTPDFANYLLPGLPVDSTLLPKTWIVSTTGTSMTLPRPGFLTQNIPITVAKAWLLNGGGTLDLSSADGSGMNLPLIVYHGTATFSATTQLKAGVVLDQTGELQLTPGSGTVSLAKPIVSLSALVAGDTAAANATIRVSTGDVLLVPSMPGTGLGIVNSGQPGTVPNVFRITGGGRVEFAAPAVQELSAASLRLENGSVDLNALPFFPTPPAGFDPGRIDSFGQSTLAVRANASVATTSNSGSVAQVITPVGALPQKYGFRQLSVQDGVLNLDIGSGALFQTIQSPASGYVFVANGATLNVNGADDTALFRMSRLAGSGFLSQTLNTGRFDMRGGQFYIHEALSGPPYRIFPSQAGFTLALNGGVFNGNFVDALQGHVRFNDSPSGVPRVDNLELTGGGETFWGSGTLEKISVSDLPNGHRSDVLNHFLVFTRSGGSVSVQAGAKLRISAGAVESRGTKNAFANDANTAFVDVENNALFRVMENDIHVGSLSGTVSSAEVDVQSVSLTVVNTADTSYAGRFAGNGPLVKTGSGQLRLAGDSSGFSGSVSVQQGTLRADHAASSTGSGNVSVLAAGILSGSGCVAGPVELAGTLAPGITPFSPGDNTLRTGSLTILSNNSLRFTLIAPGSSQDCELDIVGDVSIAGGNVFIENGGSFELGEYRLMKYSGTLTGDVSQLIVAAMPAGFAGKVVHDAVNKELKLISLAPPVSTITTPPQQTFRAATWPGEFAGSVALTSGQTLDSIEFSLREGSGNYWNGTAFGSAIEQWHAMPFSGTNWLQSFAQELFANDGAYTLRIRATDVFENVENPPAARTFNIDRSAPIVTVNTLSTAAPSPALSGTINEPLATVQVTLQGETKTAVNLGNGTWTLAAGQLTPRPAGVYDVSVQATDPAGNTSADGTINELTITLPDISITSSLSPQTGSASGGTVVTISGTNLNLATAVLFDGLNAAIQATTPTSLTVLTPEHDAGPVTVVVQSLSNTVTLPGAFNYFNPPPGIVSVSPTRVSANGGTVITITGSGFLSGAIVQVQGKNAANVVRVSRTVLRAEVPSNSPGPAAVTVQNPDFQAVSLPNAVIYDLPPQLTSALQLNTSSVLTGVPVQLLFGLLDVEGQPITHNIDWGDGTPRTTNVFHTFDTAGNYIVTLYASDGIGEAAYTLAVTVANNPNNGGGGGTPNPPGEAMIVDSFSAAVRHGCRRVD
jgi:autotransporter-associated beta strand protein